MRVLFDVADLRKRGFTGFVLVAQPKPALPTESGVYVVVREANDAPHFLAKSDAPTYKEKDPTVPIERLVAEWVEGAQTVYIGDATSLRHRVGQLGRLAAHGNSLARWGGRLLWQLDGWRELLVAWKVEPYSSALEYDLLEEFIESYGKLPFANLVHGRRNAPRLPR